MFFKIEVKSVHFFNIWNFVKTFSTSNTYCDAVITTSSNCFLYMLCRITLKIAVQKALALTVTQVKLQPLFYSTKGNQFLVIRLFVNKAIT